MPLFCSLSILPFLILWHRTLCNAQCGHQTLTICDGELRPLLPDPLNSYPSSSSADHTGHLILAQEGYWNMQLWTWGIACCISNIRLGCLFTAKSHICISCHWNKIHFVQYGICSVVFLGGDIFTCCMYQGAPTTPTPPFSTQFFPVSAVSKEMGILSCTQIR